MIRLILPLIAANFAAWGLAFAVFHGNTVLLGAALLAFTLGCRHAVDADHIAAIDNATRKLVQIGQPSSATGLYFSLGHSTVVWLASAGIALMAGMAGSRFALLRQIGGTFGTGVSALFLLGMAAANLMVLKGILAAIRRRKGGDTGDIADVLVPRGFLARLLRPVLRLVGRSRHMFAVGVLFGLGFDTASEIGVLGISAAAAGGGMPLWAILIFPALFTTGMSLLDTLDSVLMAGAYGWAFVDPGRKLYYNLAVTFVSVIAALILGGLELASLIPALPPLPATGLLGPVLIGTFALLWLGWAVMRLRRAG